MEKIEQVQWEDVTDIREVKGVGDLEMSDNRESSFIQVNGIMSKGYGFVPQAVMRKLGLSIEAKAIYAYMCSFAGAGLTAFPSVELQMRELGIGNKRYYKHRKMLEDLGLITIKMQRTTNENGKKVRARNLYIIEQFPVAKKKEETDKVERTDNNSEPCQNNTVEGNPVKSTLSEQCQNEQLQEEQLQKQSSNSNNIKNNNIKNNNNISSSSNEDDEEVKKLLKICQLENFKLKKTDIESLLLVYDFSKISKAIVTATSTNTDIKNPKGYLVSILNDMDKIKTTTVNVNKNGKEKDRKFNSDIHQREYNYDDLEKKLLGWDND